MQLTRFSDLGLRVLMYLTQLDGSRAVTISEIAAQFDVSRHHLVKVVHFMAQQGWLQTTRGKGGGLSLARPPRAYTLGELVRGLEGTEPLIDCAQPPCVLKGACAFKGILDEAQAAFYQALERHTLADAVTHPTDQVIVRMMRSKVPRA